MLRRWRGSAFRWVGRRRVGLFKRCSCGRELPKWTDFNFVVQEQAPKAKADCEDVKR